jgi:hypothetical protein
MKWNKTTIAELLAGKEFATEKELEAAIAVEVGGSTAKAAKAIGASQKAVCERLAAFERRCVRQGWSPRHGLTAKVPEGMFVEKVSQLRDADGAVKLTWTKSKADAEQKWNSMIEAIKGLTEPLKGLGGKATNRETVMPDLLNVIPMGDPHFGLINDAERSGQEFNLEIAETNMVAAVEHLVGLAPAAAGCLIIGLGDGLHSDNNSNATNRSGHQLDVDRSWELSVRIKLRAMRACIDCARAKHKHVDVQILRGNHDEMSALMLAMALAAFYDSDDRVRVDTGSNPFKYYRHGKCLIGAVHGDRTKATDLGPIMATDRPEDWGATVHRHWYTGHVHHDSMKELRGCTVETFRTLAAGDNYSNAHGYRAGRDLKLDVLHKDRGVILRHRVGVESLPFPATETPHVTRSR